MSSSEKKELICECCGKKFLDQIRSVIKRGNALCISCRDGVSYPEKFMCNLLDQLNVKFELHYYSEWTNGYYYDFAFEMKNVMVVVGTRPEAIKLCPLILELKRRRNLKTTVCTTGQHRELLEGVMRDFSVKSDCALDVMQEGQGLSAMTARILQGMDGILARNAPDLVLVQGDTATAFAGAFAAFSRRIPIGHVEAGLRTYHIHSPFPEEFHREAISLISDFHFAPTVAAKNNLIQEGKNEKSVFLTGNTVVDALKYTLNHGRPTAAELGIPPNARLLLFTAHRRENQGEPLRGMLQALRRIVEAHGDLYALCPLHPNPEIRATAREILYGCDRISMIDPPATVDFHRLLAKSYLVLTDSGGIQEETTALGIPTLVMRYSTERTEGIRAGCLRLVGCSEEGIVHAANVLLGQNSSAYAAMRKPSTIFGDGRASVRIANILERLLCRESAG